MNKATTLAQDCYDDNWKNLSQPGWSNCSFGRYLNGIWRSASRGESDSIEVIAKGRCCLPPKEYQDEETVCLQVEWKISLGRTYTWASCPDGYFLQGLYRSRGTDLQNIEHVRCCRPTTFKNISANCKDQSVRISLDNQGWSSCSNGSLIVGIYKESCNTLSCIEEFKCCQMSPSAKEKLMTPKKKDMVILGHWLLNGEDKNVTFYGSRSLTEGRCPKSKAVSFSKTSQFYATTSIISLNGRSFTISCWIKQTQRNAMSGEIYGDWQYPYQFLLSTKEQRISFHRHSHDENEEWWSLTSKEIPLKKWIHLVVTWNNEAGKVFIYADGVEIAYRTFSTSAKFYDSSRHLYVVGNAHQFQGSVMDLFVFGTALSLDEINKLRGVPTIVNKQVTGGTVGIQWEPPLEGACPVLAYNIYYRRVSSPRSGESKRDLISIDGSINQYTLHLNCSHEYEINVTSMDGHMESDSSQTLKFKPSGDVPSPPVLNSLEKEVFSCNVSLAWETPSDHGCPLIMYTIYYMQIQPQQPGAPWYVVNITNAMANKYFLAPRCDTEYKIEMTAWNEVGQSSRSKTWKTTTSSGTLNEESSISEPSESVVTKSGNHSALSQAAGLTAGIAAFLVIAILAIFLFRRKLAKRIGRDRNARPRRSKSTIIPLIQWEILREQVIFQEEIGRGAFGKVLKGIFRESPGIDVFYEPRNQTVDFKEGRTVAVKVVGERADQEAKNQFLEEIELMKAIGCHKNVVSMLGCCITSDPIFLVLEYAPYGDLQHWLRNKRLQKSYQRVYDNEDREVLSSGGNLIAVSTEMIKSGQTDAENLESGEIEERGIHLSSEESEVTFCGSNVSKDMSLEKLKETRVTADLALTTNKAGIHDSGEGKEGRVTNQCENFSGMRSVHPSDSQVDGTSDDDLLTAMDLLCFAWQITRGMSFLASKGFVHRDLAARNILLGEDRVVKISDFGLMRHTQDDVYQLRKGKRLPVKWTAPEALYNSQYTTKSDVWSFGVVLWELSTMGGNPYPGISNKELYKLLKTGYRMEKPDMCSDELFQLLLECWNEDPSARPTFDLAAKALEKMMVKGTPYLDLDLLDESKAYYCEKPLEEGDTS